MWFTIYAIAVGAAMVLLLFHRYFTRPVLAISRQVAEVDAEDPHNRLLTVPD